MDVVAAEKIAVKRKLNEDAAAFKTNHNNTGCTRKRISTCFASSCTASSNSQRMASGSANITGQKGF